jgi:hypothetical protein
MVVAEAASGLRLNISNGWHAIDPLGKGSSMKDMDPLSGCQ